jgi:uncharacterized protein YkwD
MVAAAVAAIAISAGRLRADANMEPVLQKGDVEQALAEQSDENEPNAVQPAAATGVQPLAEKEPTPAKPAKPAKPDPEAPTLDEQRVLDLVNAERRRWGRRPLRLNRHLMRVARRHAANMARWNMMSHNLGGSVSQRIAAHGVAMRSAGENIAQGQRGAQHVMNTWLASSGHRNNILSTGYSDIGVAVAYSNSGTPYWVQVFANP